MSRIIQDDDEVYIAYNGEERRLAMEIALFAGWLLVIWCPLRLFVFDFLLMDAIGILLGIAVVKGFFTAVEGRSSLGDGD